MGFVLNNPHVVAALSHHRMMLLVYTRRKLESSIGFSKIKSFGDFGFHCLW